MAKTFFSRANNALGDWNPEKIINDLVISSVYIPQCSVTHNAHAQHMTPLLESTTATIIIIKFVSAFLHAKKCAMNKNHK